MSAPMQLTNTGSAPASSVTSLDPNMWILSHPTPLITSQYIIGQDLGQPGQFGHAALATHIATGQARAVKIISKAKFTRASDRKIHFQEIRTEIDIMRALHHSHVIRLFEVFETLTELFIVMEVCTGGELFDRIKAQPDGAYAERDACVILRQICDGLQYLHAHKIAHCDLKPDNFLFISPAANADIKIIDFGMSKYVRRRRYFRSLRGTPYYIAPEVIRGHYTEHCDMWSLGVVMFVMLFGYPPFHADTDAEIFRLVIQGFTPEIRKGYKAHFPADIPCSAAARDLISKLLVSDTATRLTATEALEHPWMTGEGASTVPMIKAVINNLKSFTATTKLKQAIVRMMTTSLSTAELSDVKKVFASIDADGNGKLTVSELAQAFQRAGSQYGLSDIEHVLKTADVDGDGVLSYEEMCMTCVQRKLSAKEERLWNAFCAVDLNHDGKLTLSEIEKVLGSDGETVKKMISEVDVDGDGQVDFDEFISMWSKEQTGGGDDDAADTIMQM